MLHASTQKLIIKLYELTESGDIAWKDVEGRSRFETEGYRVEIEANPPGVRLLDTDGLELERANEAELSAAAWPNGNGTFATRVADMARRAQRVARGTEHAISRILSSLSAPPKKAEPTLSALQTSPPPSPHTLPELAPEPDLAEADTAIERVLAIQPAPRPMEPPVEEPAPVAAEAEIEHDQLEPEPLEAVEESEPAQPDTVVEMAEPQRVLAEAEAAAIVTHPEPPAPEPVIEAAQEESAPEPPPVVEPAPQPHAKSSFGATPSFDRNRSPSTPKATAPEPVAQKPEPAPQPQARPYPSSMLFTGIHARTHQTVHGEPAPQPTPPPQPQPVAEKIPEKALEPASSGSSIYKPWT
ncbi:MAG: hypothetical protein Q8R02_04515 [Hyphomonadaceae bacterium]|nr:hypothetical protein [Hyphomonadaceae bacterium]